MVGVRAEQAGEDHAGDERYAPANKLTNFEYTHSIIEARQVADTNLAIAVAAGMSGKCPPAIAATQNIRLLLPYLDKVLNETASRPEVLGPRASRRGLEASRRQLLAALDKLEVTFTRQCSSNTTQ